MLSLIFPALLSFAHAQSAPIMQCDYAGIYQRGGDTIAVKGKVTVGETEVTVDHGDGQGPEVFRGYRPKAGALINRSVFTGDKDNFETFAQLVADPTLTAGFDASAPERLPKSIEIYDLKASAEHVSQKYKIIIFRANSAHTADRILFMMARATFACVP